MKKTTGFYPAVSPKVRPSSAVGQAGGALLVETVGAWFVPGLMEAVILGKDRCHECTEKVSR